MRVLIILFFISILTACGQKGPLFMPEEEPPKEEPLTNISAIKSLVEKESDGGILQS